MADDIVYPTTDEVLELYAAIVNLSIREARNHVRDLGLLESALGRPHNEAAYQTASILRQAASLLWGLIRNHPFFDGNKRSGYVVTQAFLRANGLSIQATEDERFEFIMKIADLNGLSIGQVEDWLGHHTRHWP